MLGTVPSVYRLYKDDQAKYCDEIQGSQRDTFFSYCKGESSSLHSLEICTTNDLRDWQESRRIPILCNEKSSTNKDMLNNRSKWEGKICL